mmetsp:Transcript_24380/g.37092  ORF Transcript_24380/g.37092 Transcript_24380/m.37092 type:complete len:259 (-) Transcript_24380:111-887(-)
MLKIGFHFLTVCGGALRRSTSRRVLDECNVKFNIPLPLLPLLLCQSAVSLSGIHLDGFQSMVALSAIRLRIPVAVVTQVEVRTDATVMPDTRRYLTGASEALLYKLGSLTVLKVPQYHHGGVLGPTELVKLVVVTAAKVEKTLAGVEELTVNLLSVVVQNTNGTSETVNMLLVNAGYHISICITLPARWLPVLHLDNNLGWVLFTVLSNFLWYDEVLRLGALTIQKGNDEALLHALDGATELLHHRIPPAVLVALLRH